MTHHFAFVMDQPSRSYTESLTIERVVMSDSSIAPTFVPVRYDLGGKPLLAALSLFPNTVRDTLAGIEEIHRGLAGKRPDAVLWATGAAKSVMGLVSSAPAFLVVEMTPLQKERMESQKEQSAVRRTFLRDANHATTAQLYDRAAHLFVGSEWVARSLRHDYAVPSEKITVVRPGVDTGHFCPATICKSRSGVVRLLVVGNDFYGNGGELLLKWAQQTRTPVPWELHLVTSDAMKVLPPGVFTHPAVQSNSPEQLRLYQTCDLLVQPACADNNSLAVVEAMATGLPVLAANTCGVCEIVSEGETGMLFAPKDFDTLAARLNTLIESPDLRREMGNAARERAVRLFDARRNIGRILTTMHEVAA
ncbi:MAG: glycosyltransferase family 4 protein [Armatimonadetes bacterium]|nr:glycosyltransferase family 4 protein [Armatimonadota bacterium]